MRSSNGSACSGHRGRDGGLGVPGHADEPVLVDRELEVLVGELRDQSARVVDAVRPLRRRTATPHPQGPRSPRYASSRVGINVGDHVPRCALRITNCRAEGREGIGQADVLADARTPRVANCSARSVSPASKRAGDIEPPDGPLERRLVKLLGHGSRDLQAAIHLVDVHGGAAQIEPARERGPEQQPGLAEPFGAGQRVGRPRERLFQPLRHSERDRDLVQHPHDGCVIARSLRDRDRFVGERLAALERRPERDLVAEVREHQRPIRMVRRAGAPAPAPTSRPSRHRSAASGR